MDKLSLVSRSTAAAPSFEHIPHDVLQHILHYLPIKGARNVFRLLSKGCRDSTDYLRVAGLLQARIRSKAAAETQGQALTRFNGLMNDCMNPDFPVGTTVSLIMELINALPLLPAACRPDAMRAALTLCNRLGEKAGQEVREKCMERCIHTYQRSSEMDAQAPKFQPLNDEEAVLAARHFCSDLDPAIVTLEQALNHLENLNAAMGWASKVAAADERGQLLGRMCVHCVATFTLLNQMADDIGQSSQAERVQALRKKLAQSAMQLLPTQEVGCQAALISLALEVSANDRTLYQLAASAARRLLKQAPDSALLANWTTIAKGLFRHGVVNALIKRACEWPQLQARVVMLGELASAAFEKGGLQEMESLCAMINELAPPRAAPLYELIKKHADTCGAARAEVIVRELIPSLIALPAGLEKFVLIAAASTFILAPIRHEPGMNSEVRLGILLRLCFESFKKLIETTFGKPAAGDQLMRCQLIALADALMEQAIAMRFEYPFDARAVMRFALIELISPLASKLTAN